MSKQMPGLSFLLLKPWHPSNKTNQKRIWIAEQEAKDRQKRETEAALEILKEQEKQSLEQALQLQRDEKERSLKFMYSAPPGLKAGGAGAEDEDDLAALAEDDAVRQFRERLKLKKDPNFSASAQQSRLEQEAGIRHRAGMTIDEQVEKFPFLKGAPVEGEYAKNVQVTFKPLGKSVRNVRCMRCGEWGHKSGDRECPMRNYNPHDLARQRREDPMTYMQTQLLQDKQSLILKRSALPPEMLGAEGLNGHELVLSDEGKKQRLDVAIRCDDSRGRRIWADAAALCNANRGRRRPGSHVSGVLVDEGEEIAAPQDPATGSADGKRRHRVRPQPDQSIGAARHAVRVEQRGHHERWRGKRGQARERSRPGRRSTQAETTKEIETQVVQVLVESKKEAAAAAAQQLLLR